MKQKIHQECCAEAFPIILIAIIVTFPGPRLLIIEVHHIVKGRVTQPPALGSQAVFVEV